jgi:polysaccharide export outer membrane protein
MLSNQLKHLSKKASWPFWGLMLTLTISAPGEIGWASPAVQPRFNPADLRPPMTAQEAAYTLGAGDRIRIDIFRVPQYSGEFEVLIDGTLNLPLVGAIVVEGLTIGEAQAALSQRFGQYLRRPALTVSLLSRRQIQIGIAGEVNRPGAYTFSPQGTEFPLVTQLLDSSGGITQLADLRNVQVVRASREGQQVFTVNLWQLLQTGNQQGDFTLRDGDTVFVPTTTVDLAESPLLAAASFAPDQNRPINIAVVGEVYRPGPYTVTGGIARTEQAGVIGGISETATQPTVTRAIQVAGGIRPLANIRKVQVRRQTRTGPEQFFEVDLWTLLQEGDIRQDAILQEGDTIIVPPVLELDPTEAAQLATSTLSPRTIRVNVVGEVVNPGIIETQPNTPLNQAILAAGGFNRRARRGTVELVRLNMDGTVTRERIPVDFSQGIDPANNPALQNNDYVIVKRSGLASATDTLETILSPVRGVFSIFELPGRFLDIFRD